MTLPPGRRRAQAHRQQAHWQLGSRKAGGQRRSCTQAPLWRRAAAMADSVIGQGTERKVAGGGLGASGVLRVCVRGGSPEQGTCLTRFEFGSHAHTMHDHIDTVRRARVHFITVKRTVRTLHYPLVPYRYTRRGRGGPGLRAPGSLHLSYNHGGDAVDPTYTPYKVLCTCQDSRGVR